MIYNFSSLENIALRFIHLEGIKIELIQVKWLIKST